MSSIARVVPATRDISVCRSSLGVPALVVRPLLALSAPYLLVFVQRFAPAACSHLTLTFRPTLDNRTSPELHRPALTCTAQLLTDDSSPLTDCVCCASHLSARNCAEMHGSARVDQMVVASPARLPGSCTVMSYARHWSCL